MKNKIIMLILLFIVSCTSIDKMEVLTDFEKREIALQIMNVEEHIIELAKKNDKEKIKEKVVSGIRNNIILSEVSKYDLSSALVAFSKDVEIISRRKAKSILLVNFDLESIYLDVTWLNDGGTWKIGTIDIQ